MSELLLIHGAWQGAWAWDRLVPELDALGHRCHAVDMPGNGNGRSRLQPKNVSLERYIEYLQRLLAEIGEPVVVVRHSSGGIIASQLAEEEPDRVRGLIYVAGMMLPTGMGFSDIVAELTPDHAEVAGIIPYLEWGVGLVWKI